MVRYTAMKEPGSSNNEHISQILPTETQMHEPICIEEKRAQNELAAAVALPMELLIDIFLTYTAAEFLNAGIGTSAQYAHMRIAHVCYHWRAVALCVPELWAYIPSTHSIAFVETLLMRSRDSSLTVRMRGGDNALRTVFTQFHRFEYLALESAHLIWVNFAGDNLRVEAPRLRYLQVEHGESHELFVYCPMPVLEEAHLITRRAPWTSPTLRRPTLTRLVLCVDISRHILLSRHTWDDVVSLLQCTPLLQVLSLTYALPILEIPHSPPVPLAHAALPHLTSLCVTNRASAITNLLRRIDIPANTCINVSAHGKIVPNSMEDVAALAAALAQKLKPQGSAGPLFLAATYTDGANHIKCWREQHPLGILTGPAPQLDAQFWMHDTREEDRQARGKTFVRFWSVLQGSGLLAGIRALALDPEASDVDIALAPDGWRTSFEWMTEVTTLRVGRWAEDIGLFGAMTPERSTADCSHDGSLSAAPDLENATKRNAADTLSPPLFPNLQSIQVVNVEFDHTALPASLTTFGEALTARRTHYGERDAVKEVTLERCYHVTDRHADAFRALLGDEVNVLWDGLC